MRTGPKLFPRGCARYAGLLPILGSAALSPAAIFTSYNVVVTNNYTDQSHVQGTTYANNLDAINVPDFAQSPAAGTGDTLTVTGNITGSTITLERGVYRYAQSTAPSANLNGGSTEVHDPTISITDLANQLSNAAGFYASQPNTTVTPTGSNLNLTASGFGATYFDEPASDLDQSNEDVTLTASAGQFIIVVVPDASFSFGSSEHISLGGSTSGDQIMWDFPNATTVSLDDSLWTGSLLAPGATLTDNNQDIAGGVYVENFTQTAEVHLSDPNLTPGEPQFGGPTPSVPEPSSLLLFSAAGFVFMRRYHPAQHRPDTRAVAAAEA
jgi:choice-of-anchor A domain-containing protein